MSVAIVGAGPGDAGLITVRGLELVRDCEILVYDRLVSPLLVAEAEGAALVARDGLEQRAVNELLVRHGLRGRQVVRLKGGDPYVFGRGGEEVDALAEAGVPYEVVPGVSTLTAIPGLAGIPLTSRGEAAQLTVVTGTSAEGGELDYAQLAAAPGTLVVFMGLGKLGAIAAGLVEAGRDPDEPAAVLSQLSWPGAEVRTGTLETIAELAHGLASPAVAVIGAVAARAAAAEPLFA